jgi:hypothetical protein
MPVHGRKEDTVEIKRDIQSTYGLLAVPSTALNLF